MLGNSKNIKDQTEKTESYLIEKPPIIAIDIMCIIMVCVIAILFILIFIFPYEGIVPEMIFAAGAFLNILLTVKTFRARKKRYIIFLAIAIAFLGMTVRMLRGG
ncbi:MAG: hypothetical protein ACOX71_05240 [Lachnospiraceae bacterium]|jgi:uncharacterized membrane protein